MSKVVNCSKCHYEQLLNQDACVQCGFPIEVKPEKRLKARRMDSIAISPFELNLSTGQQGFGPVKSLSYSGTKSRLKDIIPRKIFFNFNQLSKPTPMEFFLMGVGGLLVILSFWIF